MGALTDDAHPSLRSHHPQPRIRTGGHPVRCLAEPQFPPLQSVGVAITATCGHPGATVTPPVGHGSPPPPRWLDFIFLLPFLPTQTGLASWSPLQAHADLGT